MRMGCLWRCRFCLVWGLGGRKWSGIGIPHRRDYKAFIIRWMQKWNDRRGNGAARRKGCPICVCRNFRKNVNDKADDL